MSAYTTVVWRGQWETGTIQIIIEKQGCRKCDTPCQGYLDDPDQVGFAVYWMIQWMLRRFLRC